MRKGIKDLWVNALLSKKYTQGHGKLYRKALGIETFCVFGVLLEAEGVTKRKFNPVTKEHEYNGKFMTASSEDKVRWKIKDYQHKRLLRMNDCDRLSFNEIATFIKENY